MSSSSGLGRTASAREARATTEERSLRGSSLYRQTSFTERSYMRRAESLSRQSSFSRYGGASDYYSSLSRRSTLFDGYQSFAIYSSINQGLDELSYGGRLSRRNSVTESSSPLLKSSMCTLSDFGKYREDCFCCLISLLSAWTSGEDGLFRSLPCSGELDGDARGVSSLSKLNRSGEGGGGGFRLA